MYRSQGLGVVEHDNIGAWCLSFDIGLDQPPGQYLCGGDDVNVTESEVAKRRIAGGSARMRNIVSAIGISSHAAII